MKRTCKDFTPKGIACPVLDTGINSEPHVLPLKIKFKQMKRVISAFVLVVFFNNSIVLSQDINMYSQPLKERIYVDYNTSFLLTYENLFYKVYCIKDRNSRLSNLSKVAYVELIDSDRNIVFKHKIRLINGVGNGSYFIPKSVLSGNYKLIAYTQWMRNEGNNYFFQGDIVIVNSLLNGQNIETKLNATSSLNDTVYKESDLQINKNTSDFLMLSIVNKEYKKRDKVELRINSLNSQKPNGEYSLSIRKIDYIEKPRKYSPVNFINQYPDNSALNKSIKRKAEHLLEIKGDLLTGQVVMKDSEKPVPNTMVLLSWPTGKYPLRFTTTNSSGNFEFLFRELREESTALIQVMSTNSEKYKISVEEQKPMDYSGLVFEKFDVPPSIQKILLENSIQNQIEKVYLTEKQELNKKFSYQEPYWSSKEVYILDDYNRFTTIRETVIEVIKNVRVSKRRKNYSFHVENIDYYDEDKSLPLVFVDGILVQDHTKLVHFNAKNIKKISVIREKFTYKSFAFVGIIFMETFEGNYLETLENSDYVTKFDLFIPSVNNEVYVQKYNKSNFERIPDYRRQLYWNAELYLDEKENKISFYTSDVSGDFEICLKGFNQKGQPIFIKEVFSVK